MTLTPESLEAAAVSSETWPDEILCSDNWFQHCMPDGFDEYKPVSMADAAGG